MNKKQIKFICLRMKSWHIFEGNYKDFCSSCDNLENPTQKHNCNGVDFIRDEDAYTEMLNAERKFHNFLASAKTLVDHTRTHMKPHSSHHLYEEYEKIKCEIVSDPVIKMCHDLRNHFLHQNNPIDSYFFDQTWYESKNLIVSKGYIRISKGLLLQSSGWSKESKIMIDSLTDHLDVKTLVDLYFQKIKNLNDWITSEFIPNL